jgi:hypothetical protein
MLMGIPIRVVRSAQIARLSILGGRKFPYLQSNFEQVKVEQRFNTNFIMTNLSSSLPYPMSLFRYVDTCIKSWKY